MGAIAVHHTPTTDAPWDKSAVSADDETSLHYCYAWVDGSGDPKLKGSYKFPHALHMGGPANTHACTSILNILAGGMGGADIPEGDVAGVKAHAQAHLDDAKKPANDADRVRSLVNAIHGEKARLMNLASAGKPWYRIENKASGPAQVFLYNDIGLSGTSAEDFVHDLGGINSNQIELHMNTQGGEVFDGITIMNALKNHPADVTVHVDGMAASIGSVIAMGGDRVVMQEGSQMMIHDGSGICFGNAAEMRDLAALLDRVSNTIAGIYAGRAGGTTADWRAKMQTETWYGAQEAVDAGLADGVAGSGRASSDELDLSLFNAAPKARPQIDPAILRDAFASLKKGAAK